MNLPYVTVLMPTYNSDVLLQTSIKSILKQTYQNFELLIIDDGSIDYTESIISKFNDGRINFVKKNHSGLSSTLNFGLKNAKYNVIARMDADDICHPLRLEKQLVNYNNVSSNTIICSWVLHFYNRRLFFAEKPFSSSKMFKEKLAINSCIPHSSVIYDRNFILENGGYNEELNYGEDYELWLRLLNKSEIRIINEYLVYKRFRNNSFSISKLAKNKKTVYWFLEDYYCDLKANFGIETKYTENYLRGLRELSWGEKKLARIYWKKIPFNQWSSKLLLMFILTFFNEGIINFLKQKKNILLNFWGLTFFLNKDLRRTRLEFKNLIAMYE